MALLGGKPDMTPEIVSVSDPHDEVMSAEEAQSHADAIREDQEAMLDQMEYEMGIEPTGWQDSY